MHWCSHRNLPSFLHVCVYTNGMNKNRIYMKQKAEKSQSLKQKRVLNITRIFSRSQHSYNLVLSVINKVKKCFLFTSSSGVSVVKALSNWAEVWGSKPQHWQASTVGPLREALNPNCSRGALSWLTLRSDTSFLTSQDRQINYFHCTVTYMWQIKAFSFTLSMLLYLHFQCQFLGNTTIYNNFCMKGLNLTNV